MTHHHYFGGPATNPDVSIPNLLKPATMTRVQKTADTATAEANKMGVRVRMTEGNTCYRGGKPGVSDVFAAALWSADYSLLLASNNYSGVNLHGGTGKSVARGLVLKSDAARDLVRAVQSVEKGQPFLSPAVTKLIIGHLAKTSAPGPSPGNVSPRETEVLKLLALGQSNKEVAAALDISVRTVDAHRSNIMRKLQLRTYSDLIQFAIRHEIIDL